MALPKNKSFPRCRSASYGFANVMELESALIPYCPANEEHPTEGMFVPLMEVATTALVEPTTIRRWVWKREVRARRMKDGRSWEVDVTTLPPKYRRAYAHVREARADAATDRVGERYARSRDSVRERAEFRLEAVLSLAKARAERREDETFAEVEHRWFRNFSRSHPDRKASLRSVKEWTAAFIQARGDIDALIDGNDGEKQSGARIDERLKQAFCDEYLRAHQPNLRLCYENVETFAKAQGWGPIPSYDTFRRFAQKGIPKLTRSLLREGADNPRTLLPYVRRDPTSIGAYHTIQSDCRNIDVPVRCDDGCDTCTGVRPHGHFPVWTAFIDIRSRRVLGWRLSIDVPDSDFILGIYRGIVKENGLNRRVYLDNGSNFRRAFGKRLRRLGKSEWDGPNEDQLRARFAPVGVDVVYAIVDNAPAKLIERMFRTFRHRFDEDFEAYRGTLGRKSEQAKELYRRPSELPTLSELTHLLTLAVSDYNGRAHGGRGMDGRTPDEVFYDAEIRIPRRDPDEAFELLFYQSVKGGRLVGRNGVQYGNRIYRLSSRDVQYKYFGERVDIRISPDDADKAIVVDYKTGKYLCKAHIDTEEATYDTRDEVTQRLIARTRSDAKHFLKRAAAQVEGSRTRLREYGAAKVAHLENRNAQLEEARTLAIAELPPPVEPPVALTSGFPNVSAEPMAQSDESAHDALLIETSGNANESSAAAPRNTKHPRMLTYAEFARQHGFSDVMLFYYRSGKTPWPRGVEKRFREFERLRAAGQPTREAAEALLAPKTKPQIRRLDQVRGQLSYSGIAKALGIGRRSLNEYRAGLRPWPSAELKARFDEFEQLRASEASTVSDRDS